MALAIEAGELQELFLWKEDSEILTSLQNDPFHIRVREEMADILIFLLYLAEAAGVDLSKPLRLNSLKIRPSTGLQKLWQQQKI